MRTRVVVPIRPPPPPRKQDDLLTELSKRVVGQSQAIGEIVPYIQMHRAGLTPEGRPAGVFLLLGPTGTGKTRTVEALADILHGSEKHLIKVDCGEFQMEHEVSKLLGAPPGYLGHRETQPMFTQHKLSSVTSEFCNLSLVLFDEIEKAAPSMSRLLLGVLDKAIMRLGDNTTVDFERSLIFLTSNLGGEAMGKELAPDFGFEAIMTRAPVNTRKLDSIGLGAVKRRFSPEFVNRIDAVITYHPLDSAALEAILDHQLVALQRHIDVRLQEGGFGVVVTAAARTFLLANGTSREYGARELKRVILRHLTQPLAAMVESGKVPVEAIVHVDHIPKSTRLSLVVED